MSHLPMSPDALVGLRAARWIRESTTGQFDRYGPEAQIELQDASIRRLGLVETGLVWQQRILDARSIAAPKWRPCSIPRGTARSMFSWSAT